MRIKKGKRKRNHIKVIVLDREKHKAIRHYSGKGKGHRTNSRVGEKDKEITTGSLW